MDEMDFTRKFRLGDQRDLEIKAILTTVYQALQEKGYRFFIDSPTNQLFIVLENSRMEPLSENVAFGFFDRFDDNHTVIRFCTSWATTDEDVDKLIGML